MAVESKSSGSYNQRTCLDTVRNWATCSGIVVAVLNLIALVLHFSIDKFVVHRLPWDHAYVRDLVSFVIISITILVIAIPEGLPVAVMVSLAYSVKVRNSTLFLFEISSRTTDCNRRRRCVFLTKYMCFSDIEN